MPITTSTLVMTMATADGQHNVRFRDPREGLTRAALQPVADGLMERQWFNDEIGALTDFVSAERVDVADLRVLPRA